MGSAPSHHPGVEKPYVAPGPMGFLRLAEQWARPRRISQVSKAILLARAPGFLEVDGAVEAFIRLSLEPSAKT